MNIDILLSKLRGFIKLLWGANNPPTPTHSTITSLRNQPENSPAKPMETPLEPVNNPTKPNKNRTLFFVNIILRSLIYTGFLFIVGGVFAVIGLVYYYSKDIPDLSKLNLETEQNTRIYDDSGDAVAELSLKNRQVVPITKIPVLLQRAFISAEDKRFYEHKGVDMMGILRAMRDNISKFEEGKRLHGASTITQQLVRNLILETNERTLSRKAREITLTLRLEVTKSKPEILELYLNTIFLGNRSYGVAAAAKSYFNKNLEDLSIAQIAYLAALPKAPNNYNPITQNKRATERRNWVLDRMAEDGYITEEEKDKAQKTALDAIARQNDISINDYFVNKVRDEVKAKFPDISINSDGLTIKTSMNSQYQQWAIDALQKGLRDYDRRHGYRGGFAKMQVNDNNWRNELENIPAPPGKLAHWEKAVVMSINPDKIIIGVENGKLGYIHFADILWARKLDIKTRTIGPTPKKPDDILAKGDVILVSRRDKFDVVFDLEQEPEIDGAIMVMDVRTGRVLAQVGGWSFDKSKFNRATQAERQPGSTAKPFTFIAALENNFSPLQKISDDSLLFKNIHSDWVEVDLTPEVAKMTDEDIKDNGYYRPGNFDGKFGGLLPMRVGLEKSKNMMTLRLGKMVGIPKVAEVMERFKFKEKVPPYLSIVLGGVETTLERMVTAYSAFANGGYLVTPSYIDRVQNRYGATIYHSESIQCPDCNQEEFDPTAPIPTLQEVFGEQVLQPQIAYLITDMLNGATIRGTSSSLGKMGFNMAGKTGTTNDNKDAWFIGYNNDVVVGVFMGMDIPTPLGKNLQTGAQETGGTVALPIFEEFIKKYMAGKLPAKQLRIPAGIEFMNMNLDSWTEAKTISRGVIRQPIAPDFSTYQLPNERPIAVEPTRVEEQPLPKSDAIVPQTQNESGVY